MLHVICGGMFSEKTTELQRRGKRLERAGYKVLYYKPESDNRYAENEIVSHDGIKVKSINIPKNDTFFFYSEDFSNVDALLIDEVQFLSKDSYWIINELLKRFPNLTIIVAGLDMDFAGYPFHNVSMLMAMAETVTKLQAVCTNCGQDSVFTGKRKEEPSNERITLGSDDIYFPLCRHCFDHEVDHA